jgi:hypothetical protein
VSAFEGDHVATPEPFGKTHRTLLSAETAIRATRPHHEIVGSKTADVAPSQERARCALLRGEMRR